MVVTLRSKERNIAKTSELAVREKQLSRLMVWIDLQIMISKTKFIHKMTN